MLIKVVNKPWDVPTTSVDTAFLIKDNWNDFGFYTTFDLVVFAQDGKKNDIGLLRLAYRNQKEGATEHPCYKLGKVFDELGDDYFSLGGSLEYYRNLMTLSKELRNDLLGTLNDIVYKQTIIDSLLEEDVFKNSLLRDTSLTSIRNQYRRVLTGGAPLSEYKFKFIRKGLVGFSDIELKFEVYPESKPNTNIHVLIGRNGIGKTTILNGMVNAVIREQETCNKFVTKDPFIGVGDIPKDYFSRVVSVSFSVFDPFQPLEKQNDPTKGTRYNYIGLKKINSEKGLKDIDELYNEFISDLKACIRLKKDRWLNAIQTLESDLNFSEMQLKELVDCKTDNLKEKCELTKMALDKIKNMSSGHAIVLITLTQLLATVEEKTLVLLDEPESHLHPPLLSAFIRTLSDILIHHNGVAIIATHSPVVLQEVPKSCVWKIIRTGNESQCSRPSIETFGENVGTLTRDIFGLEVEKSGFYNLLAKSVSKGGTYQSILEEYKGQLGLEGRLILKSLLRSKDSE